MQLGELHGSLLTDIHIRGRLQALVRDISRYVALSSTWFQDSHIQRVGRNVCMFEKVVLDLEKEGTGYEFLMYKG